MDHDYTICDGDGTSTGCACPCKDCHEAAEGNKRAGR